LLDKEKKFVAFGYDAENQYADLVMDKKHDDYYFFHRFKMNLQNMSCQNPTLQPLNVFSYPPCRGDKQILLSYIKKNDI
jgi:hypothetical protein